jgi:hypothetical protein
MGLGGKGAQNAAVYNRSAVYRCIMGFLPEYGICVFWGVGAIRLSQSKGFIRPRVACR